MPVFAIAFDLWSKYVDAEQLTTFEEASAALSGADAILIPGRVWCSRNGRDDPRRAFRPNDLAYLILGFALAYRSR